MTGNLQPDDRLGDFTADRRVLTLTGMAALIGVISAFVALALLRLIGFFTHLFYYHAIDSRLVSPADNRLGVWALLVPIVGGLIVGLMARYGSERIRGHGIPEALEAILIGQSRMSARVAVLKPLSSAISIGTGGPFGAEGPIIATGGAFGSVFAQAFHLSPVERKTLLVAGAAAGMAAIFASPDAAVPTYARDDLLATVRALAPQLRAASDEVEANFFVNMAQLMRGYHETQGPITAITMIEALTVAQTRSGTALIPFALDYGVWTANADKLSQHLKANYRPDGFNGKFELWVTGTLSPTAKQELQGRGFTVVENAGGRFEIVD